MGTLSLSLFFLHFEPNALIMQEEEVFVDFRVCCRGVTTAITTDFRGPESPVRHASRIDEPRPCSQVVVQVLAGNLVTVAPSAFDLFEVSAHLQKTPRLLPSATFFPARSICCNQVHRSGNYNKWFRYKVKKTKFCPLSAVH